MPRYRKVLKVSIALVVLAGGVSAFLATRHPTPAYQVAYARPETVTATVSAVGTLSPTVQAAVPPPINGTVTSIAVHVGQTVTVGETLATIAPSAQASRAKISDAFALAQAEAALAQAEQPSRSQTPQSTANSTNAMQSDLHALEQTIAQLCSGAHSPSTTSCHALRSQVSQLSAQLSPKAPSNANPASSTASGVSSATIAADQAAITADQSALASAEQVQATAMVSPIAGVVAVVPIATGQVVRPQSTAGTITVLEPRNPDVIVPIAISVAQSMHKGEPARILPFGSSSDATGTVQTIGTTPTTDPATGITTLPVTVSVNHLALSVFDGAQALVTIQTARRNHVLAVPTSAVTYIHGHATVQVMGPKGVSSQRVEVGVIGAVYTSITSGIAEGAPVVLATLNKPLPVPVKPVGALGKAFGKHKG